MSQTETCPIIIPESQNCSTKHNTKLPEIDSTTELKKQLHGNKLYMKSQHKIMQLKK